MRFSFGRIASAVLLAAGGCAAAFLCGRLGAAEGDAAAGTQPPYRKLAPGVETRVPMARSEAETSDAHPVIELLKVPNLAWTPEDEDSPATGTIYRKSTEATFRRGVWQFQFSFKPLRMIQLDLPQPNGKMERKLIWYMVYRITNPGQHMTPVEGPSKVDASGAVQKGVYTVERVDTAGAMLANLGPLRFMPIFKMQNVQSLDPRLGNKEWIDQVIPLAKDEIYRRERPPCRLEEFYNSVDIALKPIPLSTGRTDNSVWGFVTWLGGDPPRPKPDEIDPRIKYFSINIWGLTNAYQWSDPPGVYQSGDPPGKGRQFVDKVLKINFYRPGDEYVLSEDEIRLGIEGKVDWEWIYR